MAQHEQEQPGDQAQPETPFHLALVVDHQAAFREKWKDRLGETAQDGSDIYGEHILIETVTLTTVALVGAKAEASPPGSPTQANSYIR